VEQSGTKGVRISPKGRGSCNQGGSNREGKQIRKCAIVGKTKTSTVRGLLTEGKIRENILLWEGGCRAVRASSGGVGPLKRIGRSKSIGGECLGCLMRESRIVIL